MRTPALVAAILAVCLLGGCTTTAPTAAGSASPTAASVDLTRAGQARAMIRRLIAAAGTTKLIQVEIAKGWAAITVLKDNQAETWAWRDQTIKRVDSDVVYVQQRVFSIDDFNIADVGQLFRLAANAAGSVTNQELQIVDSSAGEVFMSVSTVPESRTVFFYPDGKLLPTLDFGTADGIRRGLAEVTGNRNTALTIGLQSQLGVWLDRPGSSSTTIRRQRTATVPVTIVERAQRPDLPPFGAGRVKAAAIWRVLADARAKGQLGAGVRWQVIIDDRQRTGVPRMHFTIGSNSFVTDLDGHTNPR